MIPLSIMAFGLGFGMSQRTNVIASVVPTREIGIASSVLALARNIAGAFGIAIFGTILNNATESNVLAIAKGSAIHVVNPFTMHQFIGLIALKAQISAYDTVFVIGAIVLFIGAITAYSIKVEREVEPTEKILVVE